MKKQAEEGGILDITAILPQDCIAKIISTTSVRDACCSFSLVSKAFNSAAAWKLVWERFLPLDYQRFISELVSSASSSASSLSVLPKRNLYFFLSRQPILVGDGNRSFAIDKLSGKKCYMLGARALTIVWGDNWEWVSATELPSAAQFRSHFHPLFVCVLPCFFIRVRKTGRFAEVALLRDVCWLEIQGRIETQILSPNTTYGAYFVYAIKCSSRNLQHPVKLSLRSGNEMEGGVSIGYLRSGKASGTLEERHPHWRDDKLMEIEIGEFFNGQNDGLVEMRLWEIEHGGWKFGLVVHGIELRPKDK